MLALVAVFVVGALAAGFMEVTNAVTERQGEAIEQKEAFYLAEAGLTEAFVGLGVGHTGNVASAETPAAFGKGLFWVEAEELASGYVRLDSTGMVGGATAELSLVAEPGSVGVTSLGMFAASQVNVQPGSVIDGYDSRNGTYGELLAEDPESAEGAMLGSNAGIQVTGSESLPTVIRGDVVPGPEDTLVVEGEVEITGNTDPRLETTDLPPVLVPEVELAAGITHSSALPLVIPTGQRGYDYLHVQSGAEVVMEGPTTVVVGSLELDSLGQLTLDDTGGAIRLFVTDAFRMAPGALLVADTDDTTSIVIQVAGIPDDPVELFGTGPFYGVFYAPEAHVQLTDDFEVFGSLVGDTLDFLGPVRLHFDTALLEAAAQAALPWQVSWRILELESVAGQLGGSPFARLGIDPSAALTPSAAHEDQTLHVVYLSLLGGLQNYLGPESGFDWTNVLTVISISRDGKAVATVSARGASGGNARGLAIGLGG